MNEPDERLHNLIEEANMAIERYKEWAENSAANAERWNVDPLAAEVWQDDLDNDAARNYSWAMELVKDLVAAVQS